MVFGKTNIEYLLQSFKHGVSEVTFDYEAKTISGRSTWLRRNISMVQEKNGDIIVFVSVKDIFDLVQQAELDRQELAAAKFAAEAASRAKFTFLFNMSHDIRTPMNAHVAKPIDVKKLLETMQELANKGEK